MRQLQGNYSALVSLGHLQSLLPVSIQLNQEALDLTQRGAITIGRSSLRSSPRDQTGNIHTQVAPGGKEDQTVDGLVEGSTEHICDQDKEDADERYHGVDTLGDDESIELVGS